MPAAGITIENRMGKKRKPIRGKAKTPREKFAARLRELAGDIPANRLAPQWGMTPDAVAKALRGEFVPDLDYWPGIADSLGLDDWRDLLPPL